MEVVSTAMKKDLNFVNIAGGAYRNFIDVARTIAVGYYRTDAEAA